MNSTIISALALLLLAPLYNCLGSDNSPRKLNLRSSLDKLTGIPAKVAMDVAEDFNDDFYVSPAEEEVLSEKDLRRKKDLMKSKKPKSRRPKK